MFFLVASLEPMVWLRERKRKKAARALFFGLAGNALRGRRTWHMELGLLFFFFFFLGLDVWTI